MIKNRTINPSKQIIITVLSLLFITCNKNDQVITENTVLNHKPSSEIKIVPFFELAKGDTIPKNIFREKPLFKFDEPTILFSTENNSKLKTSGNSLNFGEGYINNLFVSIRRSNTVGDWLWDGLRKIPVDLNEGAGGKWIYLFCSKGYTGELYEYCYDLRVANSYDEPTIIHDPDNGEYWVEKENGREADLNDGAGGAYVYLLRRRNGYYNGKLKIWGPSPIRDILIASGSSSSITVDGWTKVPGDLNKGAGGKYIYIFFKR